jgi:hypothetical protein
VKRAFRPFLWPLYRAICGRSDLPIFVGPWRSEVGFEALYWLPFLERLIHDWQIDRTRLIPITRGGASVWYGSPKGVELFAMRTPQDVRVETRIQHQQTGSLKQTHVRAWDRQVVRDAAETLGIKRYLTIHPAWMYQTLTPFWAAHRGLGWLQEHARYTSLPALTLEGVTLPERFVAVRFYFRPTLKATSSTVAFARETIRKIAQTQPVVVINSGLYLDDHLDFVPKAEPNVHVLSSLTPLTPENNLAVQSAVLQRADAFVGTYGGLAQLALRMGKPSISLYDDWHGTALPHRHLSEALALQLGVSFQVLRMGDLPQIQAALPTVTVRSS